MTDRLHVADLVIRRAVTADADAIGDVWLASWRATYDFHPGHPDADVRRWLREELVPGTETWVADEPGGRVVALLALSPTMVEQLYIEPGWIGQGLGTRLIDLAKARRPDGLELWTFQANARARRFYERRGFVEVERTDGARTSERQPDARYRWEPDPVSRVVRSSDGTPIAVHASGDGPPLLLVHGAAADHTTFRVLGPRLASTHTIHAIDRRGRGGSGDTLPYDIEREFEDVAAVVDEIAGETGGHVAVFGHSYGGRCALGAATLTGSVGRVISYEGAPTPPGIGYHDATVMARLRALEAAGDFDMLLATFMRDVVGMGPDDLARYRADPVWPIRVAAAPTIVREMEAESSPTAGLERLGSVARPVLQLLGGKSITAFAVATHALDERLVDGRVVTIDGARHAAHHTHPDEVVMAVQAFLDM